MMHVHAEFCLAFDPFMVNFFERNRSDHSIPILTSHLYRHGHREVK
jgi:hypothetical protein